MGIGTNTLCLINSWADDKGHCYPRSRKVPNLYLGRAKSRVQIFLGLKNQIVDQKHDSSFHFVHDHWFCYDPGIEGILTITGRWCRLSAMLSWLKSNKTAMFVEHLLLWTETHICYTRINSWLIDLKGKHWSSTAKANFWVSWNNNKNCA